MYVKPRMYFQAAFAVNPNVIAQCCLDSGNLAFPIISSEFVKKLGLQIKSTSKKAKSVEGKIINIEGETTPLTFYSIENKRIIFQEKFYVIAELSCDINLGYHFLDKHKIVLDFESKEMKINNNKINLQEYVNIIPDIIQIIDQAEKCDKVSCFKTIPGLNESSPGDNLVELQDLHTTAALHEQVNFLPFTVTPIRVTTNIPIKQGTLIYFAPCSISKKHEIAGIEGILTSTGTGIQTINVINNSAQPIRLQKGKKMGKITVVKKQSMSGNKNKDDLPLTTFQKVKFLKEKFKFEENEILKANSDLRKRFLQVLLKNFSCFSLTPEDIGMSNLLRYDIELQPNTQPFRVKPIRLNPAQEAALEIQVQKWLDQGVIEESYSPWSSPIFCVRKRAANPGEVALRFVLDFRKLNEVTIKCASPIPNIQDTLEKLGNCSYFSTLDMSSAYHSIEMTEEAGKCAAFCTKDRQYIFRRLPFGLANAPSVFCRLMTRIYDLHPHLRMYSCAYLDDVIIYSKTVIDHIQHIDSVLGALCQSGLKLNLGKCSLMRTEVKYLGHIVRSSGIWMDQKYLDKIREWPLPKTGKEIQSFLGFCNYYQSYFSNFAKVSQPLNKLRNEKLITWTDEQVNAFNNIKTMFSRALQKSYPEWDGNEFILDTDFSQNAMGAVLSQVQSGAEKMLNCASRVCSKHERNYIAFKGEIAALVYGLRKFEHMLRYKPFLVRTDNTCLTSYQTWQKGAPSGITIRWILYIQSFTFRIQHRSGKLHKNADIITRTNELRPDTVVSSTFFEQKSKCSIIDPIYWLDKKVDSNSLNFSGSEAKRILLENGGKIRSQHFARHTAGDVILKLAVDFVVKNLKPTNAEMKQLPSRARVILQYFDHLEMVRGILYFMQPINNGNHIIKRIIPPLTLYNQIFDYAHCHQLSGHKGMSETLIKIRKHFFMPFAKQFIGWRIKNCVSCFARIKPRHKHTITHSASAGQPMDLIFVDHIGPLNPGTTFNNRICNFILIVVDAYTRFVWAFPVVNVKASTTISCIMENIVPSHGLFKEIRSDRGAAFTSNLYKETMDALGVNIVMIPPRNPQSNPSERYNQGLYNYIKTDKTFTTNNWGGKLRWATFCANTSFNSRIGSTAFFKMYNREPLLPLNLFCPTSDEITKPPLFTNLISKIENGWKMLQHNTDKYLQLKNLHREDMHLPLYSVVYVYFDVVKSGVSKKITSQFLGPFMITYKYSSALYRVKPLDGCPIRSKDELTVARDKLIMLETSFSLNKDELYKLDLKPSQLVAADNLININPTIMKDGKNNNFLSFQDLSGEEEFSRVLEDICEQSLSGLSKLPDTRRFSGVSGDNKIVSTKTFSGHDELQSNVFEGGEDHAGLSDNVNDSGLNENNDDNHNDDDHNNASPSGPDVELEGQISEDGRDSVFDKTLENSENESNVLGSSENEVTRGRGRPVGTRNYANIHVPPLTVRTRQRTKISTRDKLASLSKTLTGTRK